MTIPELRRDRQGRGRHRRQQGTRAARWRWGSRKRAPTSSSRAASSKRARWSPTRSGRWVGARWRCAVTSATGTTAPRSIDATVAEFGRIDVLVNNAGIAPVPPSLLDVTSELFDKTIAVNLKGPLRLTALAAEHMTAGGSIINISSKASLHPMPFTVVYAAAKAGLNALTKAAAAEFGPRGIRVNAIVCGTFHTDSLHSGMPTESAGADGRDHRAWAGSRPPTRSSAPRSSSPATPRRTCPVSCSCSTVVREVPSRRVACSSMRARRRAARRGR